VLLTGGTTTYSLQPGLFGTALNSIGGVQPQLPAPHPSGDGAPVPVSRPPIEPNVPCETQPTITESGIQAPTGAGPQPISTSLDSPGAKERAQSAGLIELGQLMHQAQQQHLATKFVQSLPGK
jgi:hypothetical protein